VPNDPVEYRILRDLQTALGRISVSGGYHHDVNAIVVKLDPNQAADALVGPDAPRPFLVLDVRAETWDYSSSSEQSGVDMVGLILPITVHWFNGSDSTDDTGKMLEFFRACADIETALSVDPTRGFLALDTRVIRRVYDELDGSDVWAMVDVQVRLFRQLGKPNG
jgi:hypothetical protein